MTKQTKTETAEVSADKERVSQLEGQIQALESELDSEMKLSLTRVERISKLESAYNANIVLLNEWESLAVRAASALTEIAEQRVSHMVTESRMAEIAKENGTVLLALAQSFRALLEKE